MTGRLLNVRALEGDPANDGYVLTTVSGVPVWLPTSGVQSVVAGSNVTVDNTDPNNPIVSSTGGGYTYHGCAASRSTNQSITTTPTAIQFDNADEWDTDSIHDPSTNNSRFTIPTGLDGKWRFSASVGWASASVSRGFNWAKNGTQYSTVYSPQTEFVQNATTLRHNGTTDLLLVAGDYIEVFGLVGATVNCTQARVTCQFLG